MSRFVSARGAPPALVLLLWLFGSSEARAQGTEVRAINAQMIGSTGLSRDNMYMGWYDYVITFRVPQGKAWEFSNQTARAAQTLAKSTYTTSNVGGWTYIFLTAGYRARSAASPAYNGRDPWEYGNELRVKYR